MCLSGSCAPRAALDGRRGAGLGGRAHASGTRSRRPGAGSSPQVGHQVGQGAAPVLLAGGHGDSLGPDTALVRLGFRGGAVPQARRRGGGSRLAPPGHAGPGELRLRTAPARRSWTSAVPGPDQDLLDVLDLVTHAGPPRRHGDCSAGTDAGSRAALAARPGLRPARPLELRQRPGGVGEAPGGQWLRVADRGAQGRGGSGGARRVCLVRSAAYGRLRDGLGLEEAKEACGEAGAAGSGRSGPVHRGAVGGPWSSATPREDFERPS
ncbi:hypothetical protein SGRIM128S_08405 [Streptomyces griseomycini]